MNEDTKTCIVTVVGIIAGLTLFMYVLYCGHTEKMAAIEKGIYEQHTHAKSEKE